MNIIIIGGGPIGLLTAIKFALYKDNQITIYDKRIKRTRKQIIVLDRNAYNILPGKIKRSSYFGSVNPVALDQSGEVHDSSHSGNVCIQINKLEKILLEYISSIKNITIINTKLDIISMGNLLNKNDNTLFVAADGYKSITRTFLKCDTINTNVSYGLTALYKRDNKSCLRDDVNIIKKKGVSVRHILGIDQHRYRGFRSTNGYNHISLQLTEKEFGTISNNIKTAKELPDIILNILESGAIFYGMKLPSDLSKIEITLFPIKVHNAKMVSHTFRSNKIILLGDSANGPNFIGASGVNTGIKMIRELFRIINKYPLNWFDHYENAVAYLLFQTMNTMLNYTIDEDYVNTIMDEYDDEQLNRFGYVHNVYVNNLPKKEKCYVLQKLFFRGSKFNEQEYQQIQNELIKKYSTNTIEDEYARHNYIYA
jgi:2-polyprenyl-6-methoxyphenol hydroxylase-like FAD-dependent oxidoreductase